ncbi:MAG: DUF3500 domain-containing protein [Xanthobacteraceae bacterium]|nr:DUF3500 domain-containing protein [Xanthobacteraceae bacterium]
MTYNTPDRRSVIAGGMALAGSTLLPNAGAAQAGLGSAADLLASTQKFLAGLDGQQRKAATFALNAPQWRSWDYFGSGNNIKPGLRLEVMNAAQKQAAWDVLAVLFSPAGIEKTRNVMTLQDVLASQGSMPDQRSSERFSFAVFGTPAETGAWAFRLEGHHLHQSISVRDNRIVSVTPSSFSVNPNRVTSGKHAGLVTLRGEEALARRLYGDLDPTRQGRARLSATPMNNIMSYAGRERANAQGVGLPVAELQSAQRDLVWQLVETYAADYLTPALAEAQRARVRSGDREAVHFAWYGPNTAERAFGYRVIGPSFVIELGSVDPAAQHLHTIYHDLGNVLGRAG